MNVERISFLSAAGLAIGGALLALACSSEAAPKASSAPTAQELNRRMADGFNLGNTFDMQMNPTAPSEVKPLIDLYQAAGMKHVRIPVTWMDGFGGDHLADSSSKIKAGHPRLKDLEAAVDYALQKGMIVMINTHHEHGLKSHYDGSPAFRQRFVTLWTEIANRFKNRSSNLIFEVLNEPEGVFGDWTGKVRPSDPKALALTREINLAGYEAIRATGGPNKTRVIALGVNGQGNHSMFDDVYPTRADLPGGGKDPFLLATLHTYDPWDFCGQEGRLTASPSPQAIREGIAQAARQAELLGIPVNYGEFGVGRRERTEERSSPEVLRYYRTVREAAREAGMSNTPWDDRGWFGLTRKTPSGSWEFVHGIVPAMLKN